MKNVYTLIKNCMLKNPKDFLLGTIISTSLLFLYADKPILPRSRQEKINYLQEKKEFYEKQTISEIQELKQNVLFDAVGNGALILLGALALSYSNYKFKKYNEQKNQKQNYETQKYKKQQKQKQDLQPRLNTSPFSDQFPDFELYLMHNRNLASLITYVSAYTTALTLDYQSDFLNTDIKTSIMIFPIVSYFAARAYLWHDDLKYPRLPNFLKSVPLSYEIVSRKKISKKRLDKLYEFFKNPASIDFTLATYYLGTDNLVKGFEFLKKASKQKDLINSPNYWENKFYLRPISNWILNNLIEKNPNDLGRRFDLALNYLIEKKLKQSIKTIDDLLDVKELKINTTNETNSNSKLDLDLACASAIFYEFISDCAKKFPEEKTRDIDFSNLDEKVEFLYKTIIEDLIELSNTNNNTNKNNTKNNTKNNNNKNTNKHNNKPESIFNKLESSEFEVYECSIDSFLCNMFILERSQFQVENLKRKFNLSSKIYNTICDISLTCRPLFFLDCASDGFSYAIYLRSQGDTLDFCFEELNKNNKINLIKNTLDDYVTLLKKLEPISFEDLHSLNYAQVMEDKFVKRLTKENDCESQNILRKGLQYSVEHLSKHKLIFSHGNLHPHNLILDLFEPMYCPDSVESNSSFIDWTDATLCSPLLDFVHLLGHHKIKLLKEFENKNLIPQFLPDYDLKNFKIDLAHAKLFKFAHLLGRSIKFSDGFSEYYKSEFIKSINGINKFYPTPNLELKDNLATNENLKRKEDLEKLKLKIIELTN